MAAANIKCLKTEMKRSQVKSTRFMAFKQTHVHANTLYL